MIKVEISKTENSKSIQKNQQNQKFVLGKYQQN